MPRSRCTIGIPNRGRTVRRSLRNLDLSLTANVESNENSNNRLSSLTNRRRTRSTRINASFTTRSFSANPNSNPNAAVSVSRIHRARRPPPSLVQISLSNDYSNWQNNSTNSRSSEPIEIMRSAYTSFTNELSDPQQCVICLSENKINPSVLLPCMHIFCFSCIYRWVNINPSCPLCKTGSSQILYSMESEEQYSSIRVPNRIVSSSASSIIGHLRQLVSRNPSTNPSDGASLFASSDQRDVFENIFRSAITDHSYSNQQNPIDLRPRSSTVIINVEDEPTEYSTFRQRLRNFIQSVIAFSASSLLGRRLMNPRLRRQFIYTLDLRSTQMVFNGQNLNHVNDVTSSFLSSNETSMNRIAGFVIHELEAMAPFLSPPDGTELDLHDTCMQVCELIRHTGLISHALIRIRLSRLPALRLVSSYQLQAFCRELRLFALHVGDQTSFNLSHWHVNEAFEPIYQHNRQDFVSCERLLQRLETYIVETLVEPHLRHNENETSNISQVCCPAFNALESILEAHIPDWSPRALDRFPLESLMSNLLSICQIVGAYARHSNSNDSALLVGMLQQYIDALNIRQIVAQTPSQRQQITQFQILSPINIVEASSPQVLVESSDSEYSSNAQINPRRISFNSSDSSNLDERHNTKKIRRLQLDDSSESEVNVRQSSTLPVLLDHTSRRTESEMDVDIEPIDEGNNNEASASYSSRWQRKREKRRYIHRLISSWLNSEKSSKRRHHHSPSISISSEESVDLFLRKRSYSISSDSSESLLPSLPIKCHCGPCKKALRYAKKYCEGRRSRHNGYSKCSHGDIINIMNKEIQSLYSLLNNKNKGSSGPQVPECSRSKPIVFNAPSSPICVSDLTSEDEICIQSENIETKKKEDDVQKQMTRPTIYQPTSTQDFLEFISRTMPIPDLNITIENQVNEPVHNLRSSINEDDYSDRPNSQIRDLSEDNSLESNYNVQHDP